ncbi:MAG: tRNA (adenosine(37)-N6)-dimethylallyltransferase MiaA [Clostridia bacterium]|nr:tRNA (adenosine(37)-N6)-dimethylallyltransferase MiaA [Clostridia bacterium]
MSFVVAVTGPTASGKSSLTLKLCKKYNGELVSFDSMQIYKDMNIGTAKPSIEEQQEVVHHMIDICDPDEKYSTADFVNRAALEIDGILKDNKNAFICGGTGLYLDSYINDRDFSNNGADTELRDSLQKIADENGNETLHKMLEELDPIAAENIHANNVKRVIRAIEICKTSGMTKTEWDRKADSNPKRKVTKIILDFHDRDVLYNRINARVDQMITEGLVSETSSLNERHVFENNSTASQAIGYKEILPFIYGEASLEDSVETLKTATRRYAKRQLTWLNKDTGIRFYVDDYKNGEDLFVDVCKVIDEIVAGEQ